MMFLYCHWQNGIIKKPMHIYAVSTNSDKLSVTLIQIFAEATDTAASPPIIQEPITGYLPLYAVGSTYS